MAPRLSELGKVKLRRFVAEATDLEDLDDIEAALDRDHLSERLAIKLQLGPLDFEVPHARAAAAPPSLNSVQAQPLPLGALGLTALGLAKVRKGIEHARDMKVLATLDRALNQGDIPRLRQMLDLQPEDLTGEDDDDEEDRSTSSTEELGEADNDEEDEYDPFATEPVVKVEAADTAVDVKSENDLEEARAALVEVVVKAEEAEADAKVKAEVEEEARAALAEARALLEEAKAVVAPGTEVADEEVQEVVVVEDRAAEVEAVKDKIGNELRVQAFAEGPSEESDVNAMAQLPATQAKQATEEIKGQQKEQTSQDEQRQAQCEQQREQQEAEAVEEEDEEERSEEEQQQQAETPVPVVAASGPLAALQSAYADSDSDDQPAVEVTSVAAKPPQKRRRTSSGSAPQQARQRALPWPIGWAWLASRTQRHPDFRVPTLPAGASWVQAQPSESTQAVPGEVPAIALATSRVYVGDPTNGYDVHHVARIAAVSLSGQVLLDVLVRPRLPVLDCRTHITGLTRDKLAGQSAVELAVARQQLLSLMTPETLLLGYRLTSDLEALQLWHGPLVDASLLFCVDSRKQHQYHPLRYIAKKVLYEDMDERAPHDAVESARLVMRLVRHEAALPTPTPAFEPSGDSGLEFMVRHIPSAWGEKAAQRVAAHCPGAAQGIEVRWLLSEADPTEWRGEAQLTFPNQIARDSCFESLRSLTDVHVQWEDLPGAPPLGSFITEQALMKTFSSFGVVVSARLPRKPTTREARHFAFVSFLEREDAQRCARGQPVEVQLTPTWNLPLRPRIARFGNTDDKRIAVPARNTSSAEFGGLDWLHISKR